MGNIKKVMEKTAPALASNTMPKDWWFMVITEDLPPSSSFYSNPTTCRRSG